MCIRDRLHVIGDFERISDHAVNILESAEEIREKSIRFSPEAVREFQLITGAVEECLDLTLQSFLQDDLEAAGKVEPLEQVIDVLRNQLRSRHVLRLQKGECSIAVSYTHLDVYKRQSLARAAPSALSFEEHQPWSPMIPSARTKR